MTLSDKPLKWTNRLTREWVKQIRQALQDSIEVDGFDITVGNASFDDSEVTFKLNLRIKGAETREQRDLRTFAEMDNVDVSKIAEVRGEKYSLIGYRVKARSRPYIVQNLHDNKEYIFTTDMAQKYFGVEV
tara:strand:- start:221 stop:613 length:393 start_codon:yes stop_codon:yes gene_type:complete